MKSLAMALVLASTATGRVGAQPSASPPDPCAALARLELPGYALSEVKAQHVPAGPSPAGPGAPSTGTLPAHCRVDAVIDRRTGVDGKPYGIGFAVALPDDWNGRLLMQG